MSVRRLALRRFVLVGLVLPGIIALVGAAIQLVALPAVGPTIVVHWDATGAPDGYAPAWTQPLMTLGFGFGVPALVALPALPGLKRGAGGPTYRLLGATATWTSVFVVTIFTWTMLAQAGGDAVGIGRIILSALLIAFAAGIGAWFLQPDVAVQRTDVRTVAPLPVGQSEQVAWVRTTTMAPVAMWALWSAAVVLAVVGGLMLLHQADGAWIVALIGVVLIVAVGATTTFRVSVTETGLRVRSVWGLPRFAVRAIEVGSVEIVDVNPMGEFGGWGVRAAPGRTGIVLRSGPAIEVTRKDGRSLVVTVEDAATGAALLQSYAQRAASDSV